MGMKSKFEIKDNRTFGEKDIFRTNSSMGETILDNSLGRE